MTGIVGWVLALLINAPQEAEMSERMAPPGWQGNFWGPEATKARHEGRMPPIVATRHMARWDRWGRQVLRDGDIVFRLGDARLAHGYFPMSRFLANASNSKFSHTGVVAIEEEGPVVYDTTRGGVARQPFCVWVLDNVGSIGVKRLRPEHQAAIPKVLAYCRRVFDDQVPFDYELTDDDTALYCVEMTERAFRAAGIELSKPIRLGDMERASEFPLCMFGLAIASRWALKHPLTFDHLVYFPGNERHGIWSAKQLATIVPPTFAPGHPGMARSAPIAGDVDRSSSKASQPVDRPDDRLHSNARSTAGAGT
jgi:Permuted papain-like amidase enzyme, YaeF/YiiX, C92 family